MEQGLIGAAVSGLDAPGTYVHFSIFSISLANLVLIAAMLAIFGLALALPFPHGRDGAGLVPAEDAAVHAHGREEFPFTGPEDDQWTARLRRLALRLLPPDKLLPDRQPAYVSSWVYVFGVGSLVALGVAIVSGFLIALGGPEWYHTTSVGLFFNSLHLWSVELFMALLVIHLWGKFWMAAWRGRRAATWITGGLAFLISIVECFTGYLSQSNFDSQWISTNGKDAFNALGVGSFFNLMNFGQMLMWHIVLVPLVLVALVGLHIVLVRVRGVSRPIGDSPRRTRAARAAAARADAAPWTGPTRRYDILKEGALASLIVLVLVVGLAAGLSSPDLPALTLQTWSKAAPADFMATAASELAGTSKTARYGPPYSGPASNSQKLAISWATLAGFRQRIDAPRAFVLGPLAALAPGHPNLAGALEIYEAATSARRALWNRAYAAVIDKVRFVAGVPVVPAADDGPVPLLIADELTLAQSGALDTDLVSTPSFYGTNYTRPLLFLEDGAYFAARAQAMHLQGNQWGVMNETGSYPGQPWLWLYQLWYELPGWRNSGNVDLIAVYMTGIATILLLAVPFIPGLREIPRLLPVHRLVWRSWYRHGHPETTASGTERKRL